MVWDSVINTLAARLGDVDLAPGVAREFASFDNSAEMLLELARYENPAQIVSLLNVLPPHVARQHLRDISEGLKARSGNESEQDGDEGSEVAKAPGTIKPIRKAGPTASGLRDDDDIKTWMAKRDKQVRR